MIARITGKIIDKGTDYLILDAGSVAYEVLVPQTVMQRLDKFILDGKISLVTYHYLQSEPAKNIPVLIGFLNEIEKEFFEMFITVSGIGPRAAIKALSKPISEIARAIYEADLDFLKTLPGIGQQRAKEIVAKLQNKVAKFGLIQDKIASSLQSQKKDIEEEALAVLIQLQYKKTEAQEMIKKALQRNPHIKTTEELLNEVYRQRIK
ncbi:MAG: Holliday junction branch migration protein RuvA [Candidatus Omnitrophica bacterium]|nr:Holliday junction branch migration protein RuvA [Candidatus Omnitrophota bacterium]